MTERMRCHPCTTREGTWRASHWLAGLWPRRTGGDFVSVEEIEEIALFHSYSAPAIATNGTKRITTRKGAEEREAASAAQPLVAGGGPSHHSHHHHSYGALSVSACVEEGACDCDDDLYFHDGGKGAVTAEEVVDEVSIIANTINALLGVSLFAMPWGFQQSGLLCGVLILVVVAVLSLDTSRMLLISQKYFYMRDGEVKSYPEIAAAALGPHWHMIVQSSTIISCLGGCTGYIIFFGETVGQALSLSPTTVLIAATIPLILLSWIRTFRDMTIFTVFGVVALVVTVLVILYDGAHKAESALHEVEMFKPDTSINALGQITFLFTIHYTTLAMGAETLKLKTWMSQHVDDDHSETSYSVLTTPIAWSWAISAFLVGLVGIGGFVMFRSVDYVTDSEGFVLTGCEDRVCQNIVLNISPGIARNVVGFMMALAISLSFILNLAPAREHIERIIITRFFTISTERQDVIVRNVLRTVLVLAMVTVAIKTPYFGNMLGSVGGLTDAIQCFVYPPLIFLKLEGDKLSGWYRNTCRFTIVWGAFIILYTISTLIGELFS